MSRPKTVTKTWRWGSDPRTPEEAHLRITRRGVAAAIERAARARPILIKPRREFSRGALARMRMVDAEDKQQLLDLAEMVRTHGAVRAAEVVARFDTVVRDRVPRSFFLLLQQEGGEW